MRPNELNLEMVMEAFRVRLVETFAENKLMNFLFDPNENCVLYMEEVKNGWIFFKLACTQHNTRREKAHSFQFAQITLP